jgi:hypothetical protein
MNRVRAGTPVIPDDQDAGVMTASGHNQVVQVFKVIGIPRQNWEGLGDRVDQDLRIRDRQQPGVLGQDWIVPLSPESGSQSWIAEVFVDQEFHSGVGSRRPRARSRDASRSRSCSMSGRFFAT